MGTIKRFKDLEIWQLARELLNLIYDDFRNCKDFTFKNQIIDAGLSIKNNIAEGFSREKDKEFKYFLNISRGSNGEVRSMYYSAEDQKYISSEIAYDRRNRTDIIRVKITNFMFYLKKQKTPRQRNVKTKVISCSRAFPISISMPPSGSGPSSEVPGSSPYLLPCRPPRAGSLFP